MPVYRVQGPDGKIYRVQGPPNATEDQLGSFILSQNIQNQPIPESPESPESPELPPVDQSVLDANDARARTDLALHTPITQGTILGQTIQNAAEGLRQYRSKAQSTYGTDTGAFLRDEARTSPSAMLSRGALNTTVVGPGQLAANALGFGGTVNPAIEADRAATQAAAQRAQAVAPEAFQTVGEVAGVGGLPGAGGVFNPARFAGRVGNSALLGTIGAAAQPVYGPDFWRQKATQTGEGLAAGAVSPFLFEGAARVLSPQVSKGVSRLQSEGVRLTPGQISGGMLRTAEEKAQSFPIVGSAISAAKQRGQDDLIRAELNRALTPIGEKFPKSVPVGNEGIIYTSDKLGNAYDDVLAKIKQVHLDQPLRDQIDAAGRSVANLPKDKLEQFQRILNNEVGSRAQNGVITAESLKAAESNLGEISTGYLRGDYDQRKLGEAVMEIRDALRGMVARQSPENAARLQAINKGWANYKRAERAASYVGAPEGVSTPAQLHQAVRELDKTKNKSAFAKGKALMQDLSAPAKAVMTDITRNSGTADRALAAGLLMSAFKHPAQTAAGVAGALPAAALYSRPGVAMSSALLSGRQGPAWQALAQGTRQLTPLGALGPVMWDPAALATIPAVGLLGQ